LTQQALVEKAGIARSTLTLLENGSGGNLLSLIQVLRILDQLAIFSQLQRPVQISPLLLAKQAKAKRKRASSKSSNNHLSTSADW
jgi:transcriptional regulator with XRE-family HTH domain